MREKPILFDQYNRYKICARLIDQLGGDDKTILDIGSGPECILGEFFEAPRITYVDPLLDCSSSDKRFIAGDIYAPELDEKTFDVVVCVDVLEHVPPDERKRFVERFISLSGRYTILAAPCSDLAGAIELDTWVNEVYKAGFGTDYPWLADHLKYELPNEAETCKIFEDAGLYTAVYPSGYIPWTRPLLAYTLCGLESKALAPHVYSISKIFNDKLNQYADRAPNYRSVIVASKKKENIHELIGHEIEDIAGDVSLEKEWDNVVREIISAPARELVKTETWLTKAEADRDSAKAKLDNALRKSAALVDELDTKNELLALEKESVNSLKSQLYDVKEQLNVYAELIHAVYRSKSWRLTAPLRFALESMNTIKRSGIKEGSFYVLQRAYQNLPFAQYTKHRIKRPFTVLTNIIRPRTNAESPTLEYDAELPELPKQTKPDIFIWAVIDWEFRKQRPQHLAEEIAKRGYRVFYIAATFNRSKTFGIKAHVLTENCSLYLVKLNLSSIPHIHVSMPEQTYFDMLRGDLSVFLNWAKPREIISIVNHPWWFDVAKWVPNSRLIYDCMDHHEGFGNYCDKKKQQELRLLASADTIIATSNVIFDNCRQYTERVRLIRNACDFYHFNTRPETIYQKTKPIIGYFGAIAEWFDIELIKYIADTYSDAEIILIGNDTGNVREKLLDILNVKFIGEIGYHELPFYLHAFDVCIMPFVKNKLTNATNPVKIYEYLSAGKPVISIDLPEIRKFFPYVDIASNSEEFITLIGRNIEESEKGREDRILFAKENTWGKRVDALESDVFNYQESLSSLIIITYNNLELTKKCLQSITDNTCYSHYEVIIVDNASTDGSREYIDNYVSGKPNWTAILNNDNLGFAPAVNQGLDKAKGETLVVLNNDVLVTPGWLRTLTGHLRREPLIGILGPITNNIGNEARIETTYSSYEDMLDEARVLTYSNSGKLFDIRTLAFFCVMIPRDVYEEIGGLDEAFTVGFFEDDDYCRRIENCGYRIVCAEDVFIHHELSASFNALGDRRRLEIFENNKKVYEGKWGKWVQHDYRK